MTNRTGIKRLKTTLSRLKYIVNRGVVSLQVQIYCFKYLVTASNRSRVI